MSFNIKMTRNKAKELLPIIQAFAEGKTIECSENGELWSKVDFPSWVPSMYYRVKPEAKYRPFKSKDECWNEMHKHHDFGWIKGNVTGDYEQIVCVFDYCKTELSFNIANSDDDYSSEMMLNSYTFTDGTPFGVKQN